MAERGKLSKKIRRKQAQFRASEPEMKVAFIDDSGLTESVANGADRPTVTACEETSYHFFIGNGGTRNGISRELLSTILEDTDALYMPEAKDFSFASVTGQTKAVHLLKKCNGISVQETCKARGLSHLINPSLLQGPPLHLYLCLVDHIPTAVMKYSEETLVTHRPHLPPGLNLIPEFISVTEEKELLSYFTTPLSESNPCVSCINGTWQDDTGVKLVANLPTKVDSNGLISHLSSRSALSPSLSSSTLISPASTTHLKHRSVRHYGYEFLYTVNSVNPDHPLPGGLPSVCQPLLERLREQSHLEWLPDQLTVNDYQPGAGIPPHVDTHSPFEDGIVSVSLGSQVVMDFRHPDGRKVPVFLPRRSVLIMKGESRYLWTHGITPRKTDEVHCDMLGCDTIPSYSSCSAIHISRPSTTSTVIPRGRRVSLTFRKVKHGACTCSFFSQCDSQREEYRKQEK